MRSDEAYTPITGCDATEIMNCLLLEGDAYDACIAACSGNEAEEENLPGYAKVSGKAEASQSVALNAVDKKVGTITLKAGENETTVTNVEITKAGLWARTDIATISLMKDGEYVTNSATLNSNSVAKLRFRPNLTLKANSSETFDVVVTMAWSGVAVAWGTHDFSVTAVTVANGTFDGTPVKLGSLTTTNYLVPELTVAMTPTNAKAGDSNKEIVRVALTSPTDAVANGLTLTATLSGANDDLFNVFSNAKAYIDDKEVGSVSINTESLVVNGLDADLEKNETVDVVIKADTIYLWTTLDVILEAETWHVVAIENNTKERMNSLWATATVQVQWVDLTITKKITATQTVATKTKNVVLLDMEVSSSRDIDITAYKVKLPVTQANLATNFQDGEVTLYVDGVDYTIKSWAANFNAAGDEYTINGKYDAFTVSKWSPVRIQVKGTPILDNQSYTFDFTITTAKNVETNVEITNVNKSKTSHKTTVKWWNVTVTKWTTPSGNTIEEGTADNEVLFFDVKASSEDAKLTWATISFVATDTNDQLSGLDANPVEALALYVVWENSPVAEVSSDDLSKYNTWTSELSWTYNLEFVKTMTKDATTKFVVKATLANWEVSILWSKFTFSLDKVYGQGVTSKNSFAVPATAVAWKPYSLSTETPDMNISTDANNIIVEVVNNSSYDVTLYTGTINLEVLPSEKENYLMDMTKVSWSILDSVWGDPIAGATYDFANWVISVNFSAWLKLPETFVIELKSNDSHAIKAEYYSVSKKWVIFNYTDAVSSKTSNLVTTTY